MEPGKKKPAPRVSIVLATYNGERFLGEAVESCLNQTFRDLELIVVVDGSADNSLHILDRFRDDRLIVESTSNRGQARALNTGFEMARGELLSWASDDNIYEKDAFLVMVDYLDKRPEAAAVSTDGLTIDDSGKVTGYEEFAWQCFLFRKDAGLRTGPVRPEARIIEDIDFFLRFKRYGGPVHRIAAPYLRYRAHGGTVSARMAAQRPLVSLKLNYDLRREGVIDVDLEWLFFDRLSKAALYRNHDAMNDIVEFAESEKLPFHNRLEKRRRLLSGEIGWVMNRLIIAAQSQPGKVKSRLKLLKYLARQWHRGGVDKPGED